MAEAGLAVARMRANLAAAGIHLSDSDLDAIAESPFLQSVVAFDERSASWSAAVAPDYLSPALKPRAEREIRVPDLDGDDDSARDAKRPDPPDSLRAVAARLRAKEVSPVDLTRQALERIGERDRALNIFQEVLDERAIAAARRAEREIAAGSYRGTLHGVPIAIKDLIALRGTETRAGSRVLVGNLAAHDAAVVERLEAAGAVIVGKTRMSEFAYLPGSSNAHYGPTRNPHDPERDAGGSSSGSAVAVAEKLVFAAIGSDTGGSIRIPAAFCGVVGFKPTFGRISLHGVVPLSWSLDHLGPLTRTVADAAILLDVLTGPDPRDARTAGAAQPPAEPELDRTIRGLRIGVPDRGRIRGMLGSDAVWSTMAGSLSALAEAGAEIVSIELPELEDLWLLNNAILAIEAATFHESWLRSRLDEYGEIPRRRLLSAYAHAPGAFVRAQRARAEMRDRLGAILRDVELLAMPAQPDGAPELGTPGWTLPTGPFNALGWPALTVPAGYTADRLPLGLQIVGRPWEDAAVLRAGRVVELAGAGER